MYDGSPNNQVSVIISFTDAYITIFNQKTLDYEILASNITTLRKFYASLISKFIVYLNALLALVVWDIIVSHSFFQHED